MKQLLLLHGALGSRSQFDPIREKLQDRYKIHNINFEGHGGEPAKGPFSVANFSGNVLSYLEKEQLHEVVLFGYSMGGYVALDVASKYPSQIKKVITLGTKIDWKPEIAAAQVKFLDPKVIKLKVPHFAKHLTEVHGEDQWQELLQKTANFLEHLGNGAALTETTFAKINTPVVVGLGSEDRMVTVAESEQLVNTLPNAIFKLLEGVPHELEKADLFKIVEFITENL